MKVIHTFYESKGFGGSETFFTILRKNSRHQHQTQFVDKKLQYKETFTNFESGFSDLVSKILEMDFDIVHNHFFLPAFYSAQRGIRNLFTSHCMLSQEFLLSIPDADTEDERRIMKESYEHFKQAEAGAYPQLKHIYVFSDFHRKEIEAIGGTAIKIPLLMDTSVFGGIEKKPAREKLKIPDQFTLLFLGRPTHYKGLGVLLDSLKFFDSGVQLVLLSDGVFIKDGKLCYSPCVSSNSHLREIPIPCQSDRVILRQARSREDVSIYHSAADVLVCPSLYESVGYVNLEAMASGLPIVASNTCGIPEFVINGQTGLLFQPGNSFDLAEKVETLRYCRKLSDEIKKNQKTFIQGFDVRTHIAMIDKLYEEIK